MRWLPYPTCRLPLRRLIASIAAACLFGAPVLVRAVDLDDPAIRDPYCGKGNPAAANFKLKFEKAQDGTISVPTAKGKQPLVFDRWRAMASELTPTHSGQARGATIRQSVTALTEMNIYLTGEKRLTKGYLEQAKAAQDAYLEHLIEGTATVCEQVITGSLLLDSNAELLKVTPQKGCDFTSPISLTQTALTNIEKERTDLENVLKGFESRYARDSKMNEVAIDSLEQNRRPTDNVDLALVALRQEKESLFGKNGATKLEELRNSLFGRILSRWDYDRKTVEETAAKLKANLASLQASQAQCKNLSGTTPLDIRPPAQTGASQANAAGGSHSPSEGTRDCITKPGVVSGTCAQNGAAPGQGGISGGGGGETRTGAGEGQVKDGDGVRNAGGGGGNNETRTGQAEIPDPNKTPRATSDKSFLDEHGSTLLIAGGVAAAGGGAYLLYDHVESKKEKSDAKFDALVSSMIAQQNAANSSGSSSSDSSSSSSTSSATSTDSYAGGVDVSSATPSGSTLMISGIPAGATAGQTIKGITVKIVGPNGVMTQDSNTDVTVSCVSPTPCSINGTLTVNTDLGKAEFNNISFTSGHSAVKLQFTAIGFATAVSTATFDVSQ